MTTARPTRTGPLVNQDDLRNRVTNERLRRGQLRVVHPVRHHDPVTIAGAVAIDTTIMVDVLDCVTDLTSATIRRESFTIAHANDDGSTTWIQQRHITSSPSLLEQLWSAVEASGSTEGGQRSFASKPSARLDAIDAAQRIDTGAFTWLRRLGLVDVYDDKTLPDTAAAVKRLGSLLPSAEKCGRKRADRERACCPQHELELDLRSWWTAARILTGWDSPAWKPDNTCPVCEVRGSLRIKLEHRSGMCVDCGSTWPAETIGLLADHIRAENHEDESEAS
ncbi:hypothetical protein [Aeromicrobium sp. 9AM]|uniref:DUF7341 domain-containing protein n=1 Tax=Aeromicrobium sp. 9AM TaxID=2653126 RepID=UPI0012F0405C|nr:hypothetical protein [Aeromicrobium sp. 9AM]VXB82496.1 hypothetical protein AERO9AM_20997 [Aeromicrobium sp. 9AM]